MTNLVKPRPYSKLACSLVFELAGPKYRAKISIFSGAGWILSLLVLPWVNLAIPHFRYCQLLVTGYEAVFALFLWKLPESPRWLLSRGKFEEAEKLITKIATINRKPNDDIRRKMTQLKQ